jgi:hypothetical protein
MACLFTLMPDIRLEPATTMVSDGVWVTSGEPDLVSLKSRMTDVVTIAIYTALIETRRWLL